MSSVKITCDSTCDLPAELLARYDIDVLPLGVALGDTLYHDSVDITADGIFSYVEKTGDLPKTSAVSIAEYMDVFKKYTDAGCAVIHINISSAFSACHQNARLAAEEVGGDIFPIDSRNLSTGSALLAIAAAEMAAKGMEAADIADAVNALRGCVDASFVLQTLEYLKKGGRCSTVAALGANLLRLRPEIEVTDGTMGVGRKYRGTAQKSIADYIRGRLEGRDDIDLTRVFVTHSRMEESLVEEAVALVRSLHPFAEVLVTTAGCTVSSHCGPGCIGVLFMKKA